jgi:hypothetical protein
MLEREKKLKEENKLKKKVHNYEAIGLQKNTNEFSF